MKKHDVWNGLIRFRKFHVFRHEQTWTIISKTCFSRVSRVSRVSSSTTFFIWARQNVIESKWNSWSLVWPGDSILEQKIVHVIASYLAIHMKILEKCISNKCFLLLWFIGGKKLKWIKKNFLRNSFNPDTTASSAWDREWRSMDPWYVILTCISLVSEYGLISLSAHGGKEKTWDADKIATKNCIFEVSGN